MADARLDPLSADQRLLEVERLFADLIELAEQTLGADHFHRELLRRVQAVFAAQAAGVWLLASAGPAVPSQDADAGSLPLLLAGEWNIGETGVLSDPTLRKSHDALLRRALGSGEATVVPPSAANPTESLLLLAPVRVDARIAGLIEVFLRVAAKPAAVHGQLRFLQRIADVAGRALRNREYRELARQGRLWGELDAFLRAVHAGTSPTHVAYLVANDGRRLIGCERVSVAIRRRRKTKIVAISGQELVARRSNLVRRLAELVDRVLVDREPLVHEDGVLASRPPRVQKALDRYLAEGRSRLVVVRPLTDPGRPPGRIAAAEAALVVEMIEDAADPEEIGGRIELIARHGGQALFKAIEDQQILLRPVSRGLGRALHRATATQARFWGSIVAVAIVLVLTLVFLPWPLRIEGKGELVPLERRTIYAPAAGIVQRVAVGSGTRVQPGTALLQLASPQLQQELTKLSGDLEAKRSALASLQDARDASNVRSRTRGEVDQTASRRAELQSEIAHLQNEIQLVQSQMAALELRSPIAGEVLDWNPQEHQWKPVQQGEELLQVGETAGEWVVEVQFPEKGTSHVARAWAASNGSLPATYLLQSAPERPYRGRLDRLSAHAQLVEKENVVRGRLRLDEQAPADQRRSGLEVRVKVDCGDHPLGYVLLRDVIDWVRSWVFF